LARLLPVVFRQRVMSVPLAPAFSDKEEIRVWQTNFASG
jgi:hypothetical protein